MRRSAREGNVLLDLRRIPTRWAHLSYTLSMWLLQVRVSLKITPRCLWIFTCGIGMPAIDMEGCGATPFNRLPQIIICSLFSALNSIPQISAQDEAAVTSRDRATVVVVMFFPVVYAVVSSANMEQLFVIDFGKSLMKIKNRRGPSTVPWGMPDIKHCVSELLPLTRTHCCLFVRKDENQRKVSPENPKSDNLNNRPGIDTRS